MITCKEALDLARAALEDDAKMTAGPWACHDHDVVEGGHHYVTVVGPCHDPDVIADHVNLHDGVGIAAARAREPELARFVEAVLSANPPRGSDAAIEWIMSTADHYSIETKRSLAAALLRASYESKVTPFCTTQYDPTCAICGERRSAHVSTSRGPLTHPREARGEGTYVLESPGYTMSGAMGGGPGPDDVDIAPRYGFQPAGEATKP